MKHLLSICFIISLVLVIFTACKDKSADADKNWGGPGDGDDIVCCESFGYGSHHIKCCEKYEFMPSIKCRVPDNFTGGGKKIVDDSFCKPK